ncbi:hypothetical protein SVAN01_07889 [Stagonosporopsis vannaccii]|nr:hypothetical protein SVAN01_07889 [Stagonosporopsis vannaccii]
MYTFASHAEPHRMLSSDEEAYARHHCATAIPQTASDPNYLQHMGAHFSQAQESRKGSFPVYPEGVEVSGDEAEAAFQPVRPVPETLLAYELQHSLPGGSRRSEQALMTRDYTQDHFCVSSDWVEYLLHQRSGVRRHNNGSAQSQLSRASTPTQTYDPCQSTLSDHSECNGATIDPPVSGYTTHLAAAVDFSESHTPSHCSVVTDENELYNEGIGPSSPYPYSNWDPFRMEYVPDYMEMDGFERACSVVQDASSANGDDKGVLQADK